MGLEQTYTARLAPLPTQSEEQDLVTSKRPLTLKAQTEVTINSEIEPSAAYDTFVSLVGEIETKKAPKVKVEVGGVLVSETSVENPASGSNLIDITSFYVPAGAKFKVPTVTGLAKIFASYTTGV